MSDIHVLKVREPTDEFRDTVRPAFFSGAYTHYTIEQDVEGHGRWIRFHNEHGGSVNILTRNPIVFAEPESH